MKTLRAAHINIVAIHDHMIGEAPRYVFLHYCASRRQNIWAQGLKSALDTQSKR